jgi:phytoene dehydrogenase-like protein
MIKTKSVLSLIADVVVVGGGLAGLTSATLLARAGYAVTLIEQSQHLGGRAITQNAKGFHFNLGPHALYRAGQAANILHELGVSWKGKTPTLAGSYAVRQGKPFALPLGLRRLLTSQLFGIAGKLEVSRVLAGLGKIDTTSLQHLTLQDWLHQATRLPEVRQFVEALVRLTTYTNAPDRISAGAALAQLQLAFSGITYIDGGWQVLVEGLRQVAQAAGVRFVMGAQVASIEHDAEGGTLPFGFSSGVREPLRGTLREHRTVRAVRLTDGSVCQTTAVVLAINPKAASQLVGSSYSTTLHRWVNTATPVQAACLDVALDRLPCPGNLFALGIDQPVYLSVHSAYAKLAPQDGAVIHVMKLDASSSKSDRKSDEQELEALLDLMQPGWRNQVVARRFLPKITVAHAIPCVSQSGGIARLGPRIPEIENLYVVGDWLGGDGFLADAALSSARQAVDMIMSRRECDRPALSLVS